MKNAIIATLYSLWGASMFLFLFNAAGCEIHKIDYLPLVALSALPVAMVTFFSELLSRKKNTDSTV